MNNLLLFFSGSFERWSHSCYSGGGKGKFCSSTTSYPSGLMRWGASFLSFVRCDKRDLLICKPRFSSTRQGFHFCTIGNSSDGRRKNCTRTSDVIDESPHTFLCRCAIRPSGAPHSFVFPRDHPVQGPLLRGLEAGGDAGVRVQAQREGGATFGQVVQVRRESLSIIIFCPGNYCRIPSFHFLGPPFPAQGARESPCRQVSLNFGV